MKRASFGPLVKAVETARVFARNVPSPRALLANRRQRFDRLHAILPSTATPGESLSLTLQAWDQCERLVRDYEGSVTLGSTDPAATYPATLTFEAADDGWIQVDDVAFETPGIQYLTFTNGGSSNRVVSNPVRVAPSDDRRVYWGDIHLHSTYSDGVSDAERGYRFGRNVMALDVVAYTDHDSMGFFIPPQWQRRRMHDRYFDRLTQLARTATDDHEFVALAAYEWTKQPNMGGHLNVYFEDPTDATLFDSLTAGTRTYEGLWERLREWDAEHDSRVVTIPHHPAESMYPFDFASVEYDDEMAPLVEVYSQWGSSERPASAGNRIPLAMGQGEIETEGHYVRDAHRLGYRVGMIGGSDYHGPHPGHSLIHTPPHLPSLRDWRAGGLGWSNIWRLWDEQSYPGGLSAFLAPELTREAVMDALCSRAVYATSQPHRILVDFRIEGVDVATQSDGITVDAADAPREVTVEVAGTEPVEHVTVVKNNEPWRSIEGTRDPAAGLDTHRVSGSWTDDEPITGMSWDDDRGTDADVYTVRVRQASAERYPGRAWVGPLWVDY